MDLKGKVAIVTGASSGIGRDIARTLNEAGTRCVLTARRKGRLESLASELSGAAIVPGDISDPSLPKKALAKALDAFDRCDILVNAAGIMHWGSIEDVCVEDICRMVRVNVEGTFRITYEVLKHFKCTGSGFLINISSILGTKVRPATGAYSATKYAIEALTESLRMELAKTEIGIACIEPGLVDSELHKTWGVDPKKIWDIPTALKPHDIASIVRFILEKPAHVRIPRILVTSKDQAL